MILKHIVRKHILAFIFSEKERQIPKKKKKKSLHENLGKTSFLKIYHLPSWGIFLNDKAAVKSSKSDTLTERLKPKVSFYY